MPADKRWSDLISANVADRYDDLLAAAAGDLDRLVRRCRSLTARGWEARRQPVTALLTKLAELSRLAEHGDAHVVPELPDHALADAVAVIGTDVIEALHLVPDSDLVERLGDALCASLDATR
jgi:hypothetical protein